MGVNGSDKTHTRTTLRTTNSYSLLVIPVKSKAKGNLRMAAIFLFHAAQKNLLSECSLFQMYDNKSFHYLGVNGDRKVSLHKFSRPPCEKFLVLEECE